MEISFIPFVNTGSYQFLYVLSYFFKNFMRISIWNKSPNKYRIDNVVLIYFEIIQHYIVEYIWSEVL